MTGHQTLAPVDRPQEFAAASPAPPESSIWRYLGLALSAALLLLVVGLGVLLVVIPKMTGATPLTVLTSSMAPGLPPGTLVIVRPVAAEALRIGDVVTYQMVSNDAKVVTHRIISITSSSDGSRSFIVQGDNNSAPDDDPVLAEQVQGRLWYAVPYVGYVNNVLNGANRAWIIPVLTVALFGYAGFMVAGGVLDRRRTRSRAADASEPGIAGATRAGAAERS
ncbi:signal peptidase I [Cryobacterium sp. Hb1]|uniref:signal peptidase I n=1 Tax=Cryobacterium sp. Hb1 TaxID=1259147 RepID=UPI00106D320E|nr:signal peptidase I [Cryobacterium sp. Hb1]TFD65079.1 signal peptidase I [Cryobacterium sp. Hb1]